MMRGPVKLAQEMLCHGRCNGGAGAFSRGVGELTHLRMNGPYGTTAIDIDRVAPNRTIAMVRHAPAREQEIDGPF